MQNLYSDIKSKEDLLHRSLFAKGIARNLVHSIPEENESLVFGLNGRWGFGKSTLLDFIVEEIKILHQSASDERFEIFEFNPWMFSGQEQLLLSFYRALLKRLEQPDSTFAKLSKSTSDWLDNSNISKALSAIPFVGEHAEKAKRGIQYLVGEGDLEDVKEKLDEVLIKEKIRLYVIMDDLDRLTPEEITQVFQLVKLSANFKNTVFLLAYDKDIVVNAVEQKFKDNGERYLAKIVQVDYTLPEMLEEDIESIFFEKLAAFFKKFEIPISSELPVLNTYWFKYGLKNYFRTLRDVYRYLNGLSFRLPEIWEEVNVVHFLVVEAIRVFDYSGYQNLYFEGLDWVRKHGAFPNFATDNDWVRSKFPNSLTRELLLKMRGKIEPQFPRKSVKVSNDLFSTDAFEKYFALRISQTNIAEKDFNDFLKNPEQIQVRLIHILENDRFDNMLRRLATPGWEDSFSDKGADLVPKLINFFDHLSQENRSKYLDLLQAVIDTIILVNQKNENNLNVIHNALFELGNSYPQTTRFLLLVNKWDYPHHPNENTEDKEQRKIIKLIRAYAKRWCESVARDLPSNIDNNFARDMLETVALLDTEFYPDVIKKYFVSPSQMVWLMKLALCFDKTGKPIHWWASRVHFLPEPVRDYFHTTLTTYLEEEEMPQSSEIIRFFLETKPAASNEKGSGT